MSIYQQAKDAVLDEAGLVAWRGECKQAGRRVVVTNGCFDLIHVGHLRCLEYARSLGDCLVVAVNSDASVRQLKGEERPYVNELDRAELLAGLECVDRVIVFSEMRLTRVIEQLSPDVYAKGGDYNLETMDQGERVALEACGTEIDFFKVIEGKSTTNLVERISNEGGV